MENNHFTALPVGVHHVYNVFKIIFLHSEWLSLSRINHKFWFGVEILD